MSTALVLLMTPALAFFYGGLVRSKNSLNTMMMSYVALGFIGILWALVAYSLVVLRGLAVARRIQQRAAERCGPGPQGHHSAPAVHGVPGHLRDHHGGPDLGRHRRADALLALRRVHLGVAAGGVRPGGPLGLGRWLARRRAACSTSPAAPSCTSTPASRRWWQHSCSAAARTTDARRSCRTTCRSCCSAPACSGSAGSASTAAAHSRPTPSAALAFTNTFLAPMATLVVWCILDTIRTGHVTAVGGATGIVVGLVAITPAAGFVSPHRGTGARRHRHVPQLLRHPVPRPHAARRFARCVRGPWHRRAHRRAPHRRLRGEGMGRHRWPPRRQPGPAGQAGARRWCIVRLRRRHDVHHPQGARPRHDAPRRPEVRGTRARRDPAWRGGLQHRRGLDPRAAR